MEESGGDSGGRVEESGEEWRRVGGIVGEELAVHISTYSYNPQHHKYIMYIYMYIHVRIIIKL